ncbi:MAG TPA: helix-turn-helix transcriptional regulator [Pseudonocardiaceae bacterium]|nr:helix-turn-helix transcriptional regulator [Pseudonocardiaceae bacterium]
MAVGTTRGKRRLGRFVKPIRLRAELSAEQVAERASCSAQTVYRLEAGEALPSRTRVAAILAVLQATSDEREAAFQLWEVADVDGSVIEHAEDLPVKYRRFRMDENEAVSERTLDMVVVPGLLQIHGYTTAMSTGSRPLIKSGDWEDRAGAERAERRALLTRSEPLAYHALIGAAVLRTTVGSRSVMVEQLDHLLTMTELENVTIQVLPSDFGAHGLMTGPVQLLRFVDNEDAAYAESVLGTEPVQDADAVAALSALWGDIAAAAPSPEQSREMIRTERNRK